MGRNKDSAVNFLKMVVAGKIEEAYAEFVDLNGKHHNIFTPAGFPALKKGMADNEAKFPKKKFDIQHVLEDGEMVATHSRVTLIPGELELGVVHWFRFENGKIAELWDIGQQLPKDVVNQDGMF
jgi:predicted SnoaL-like aldol condensation-catalyzing enzyme